MLAKLYPSPPDTSQTCGWSEMESEMPEPASVPQCWGPGVLPCSGDAETRHALPVLEVLRVSGEREK